MTDTERLEQYHRDAIAAIHRRAKQDAQPHIDALVKIECMKPPKPLIVPVSIFLDAMGEGSIEA